MVPPQRIELTTAMARRKRPSKEQQASTMVPMGIDNIHCIRALRCHRRNVSTIALTILFTLTYADQNIRIVRWYSDSKTNPTKTS
jgi:hypothetical protein